MILGEYDYDDYTLTNPEITELDTYTMTLIHEYTHMMLSMKSNVGLLVYCLKRIIPPTEKCEDYAIKKNLLSFLADHYLKVQEGMAVFSECLLIIMGVVDKDCNDYLNELKLTNRTYYKYIY